MCNYQNSRLSFKEKKTKQANLYQYLFADALTLYLSILTSNDPENEAFWKHCVTSIFSFSLNVFYLSGEEFLFLK